MVGKDVFTVYIEHAFCQYFGSILREYFWGDLWVRPLGGCRCGGVNPIGSGYVGVVRGGLEVEGGEGKFKVL